MGNPDVGAPARVVDRLKSAAGDARLHRYLNPRGLPELREAVARWWSRRHAWRSIPSARCS